jgi:hypothetical protein
MQAAWYHGKGGYVDMFSTILEKTTSLFDGRALLSAFFPGLIFWILTVVMVVILQLGWNAAIKMWDGLSGTTQALLLIGFFAWITFWSFVTLNFRASVMRLYEGYWPTTDPFAVLLKRRRKSWQKRWEKLDRKDQELEEKESMLLSEKLEYENFGALQETDITAIKQILPEDEESIGEELDRFLTRLESSLDEHGTNPPSAAKLQELGQQTRERWLSITFGLTKPAKEKDSTWAERYSRLDRIKERQEALIKRQFGEVQEQRLWLDRDLFLYYPPTPDDIMPTRLGNVLKAAEMYTTERYHLDSVLIWSRLQSSLPKKFAEPLRDAESSLDLMVTISTFILLFGVPLSVWSTFKSPGMLPWWVPLLLAIIALPLRFYVSLGLALVALILYIVPFTLPSLATISIQVQFLALMMGSVLLLAWLSYQNAIQSALSYGEKIRAAFDLYRWKVLEGLNLQPPTDYEEEKKLWEEVCGLLYRGYTPNPRYYRYVQREQAEKSISSQTDGK